MLDSEDMSTRAHTNWSSRIAAGIAIVFPWPALAQVFNGPGLDAGVSAAGGQVGGAGVIVGPSLLQLIGNFLVYILPYSGALALLAFVVSGILFIIGFGNEATIQRAKQTATWSLVGLVVILLSYTIINFVISF